jgi:hypothetical protein
MISSQPLAHQERTRAMDKDVSIVVFCPSCYNEFEHEFNVLDYVDFPEIEDIGYLCMCGKSELKSSHINRAYNSLLVPTSKRLCGACLVEKCVS